MVILGATSRRRQRPCKTPAPRQETEVGQESQPDLKICRLLGGSTESRPMAGVSTNTSAASSGINIKLPPELEKVVANPDLSKAIQLAEQAFALSATDPTRASNIFEKSSIAFLQAIRTTEAAKREVVRRVVDLYIARIEVERLKLTVRVSGGREITLNSDNNSEPEANKRIGNRLTLGQTPKQCSRTYMELVVEDDTDSPRRVSRLEQLDRQHSKDDLWLDMHERKARKATRDKANTAPTVASADGKGKKSKKDKDEKKKKKEKKEVKAMRSSADDYEGTKSREKEKKLKRSKEKKDNESGDDPKPKKEQRKRSEGSEPQGRKPDEPRRMSAPPPSSLSLTGSHGSIVCRTSQAKTNTPDRASTTSTDRDLLEIQARFPNLHTGFSERLGKWDPDDPNTTFQDQLRSLFIEEIGDAFVTRLRIYLDQRSTDGANCNLVLAHVTFV